jgi:hypothetical protein
MTDNRPITDYRDLPAFPLHVWTPKGRKTISARATYRLEVINHIRAIVRETGYHMCKLIAANVPQDECWSRSFSLYKQACESLRKFDETAEDFILKTYCPYLNGHRLIEGEGK